SYSISKAALNMATRQLAAALAPRGVTVFCAHPGWVKTDMGGAGATLSPHASIAGLLKVLDAITPADAGSFFGYTGKQLAWRSRPSCSMLCSINPRYPQTRAT